jgi:hypothetical protein
LERKPILANFRRYVAIAEVVGRARERCASERIYAAERLVGSLDEQNGTAAGNQTISVTERRPSTECQGKLDSARRSAEHARALSIVVGESNDLRRG